MTTGFPMITVIVPVYNVEKYLQRCIDSLLNQTYPNIEIILVNDGSTDRSWEICQDYASSYSSVRALKKTNGGLSSARNFGLNSARGEYIGFIDSDDWVAPDMYEYLYRLIADNSANAAQVEYELAYDDSHEFTRKKEHLDIVDSRVSILEYYMEQSTQTGLYSVCICLFTSSLAQKYKFREGKTSEDMDYKYNVLSECNRFVSSNLPKYHYFQAGSSISSGKLIKKNFELYESAEVLYNLTLNEDSSKIEYYGRVKKARTAFSLLSRAAFYGVSEEIDKSMLTALVKEHRKNISLLLKAPLPFSRKIAACLLAINYNLASNVAKLYRKIARGHI